ncbi:MAG: alpha/beta fold hydrolase, partial [Myxococcales bacterium]|nr:alpha/beta fold hydrolase [Myxococcales bacterium]
MQALVDTRSSSPSARRRWVFLAALWTLLGGGCAQARVHAPSQAPRATPSKTVVLVHGMFVDPSCWDRWIPYLESKGYRVLAPAWPGHEGDPAQARAAHPDPALAAVGLEDVVDRYRQEIAQLDEKPILVGHSMGGLVVQRLLAEDLAAAAVAIDAAPPKGVLSLSPKFLKSNGRILRGSLDEPLDMDAERFAYMFVNEQPPAQQQALFERYARPESRRV